MSVDAGEVVLRAALCDGCLRDVAVRSSRPRIAGLLAGRTPAELQAALPLVFSICGRAHAAAVGAAVAAARGEAPAESIDARVAAEGARELMFAVLSGDLREHLPRLQRGLPEQAALRRLLESELLGAALPDFLSLGAVQPLVAWAGGNAPLQREARRRLALSEPCAVDPLVLPDLAAGTAAILPVDAAFAEAPTWRGTAAETGPYARQHARPLLQALAPRPLLQRWLSRLIELLLFTAGERAGVLGRVTAVTLNDGRGLAAVETARGTLLHVLGLQAGCVRDHVIVAPTEWNFHPAGNARAWLEGRAADSPDAARVWMQRVCEALDPCVSSRLVLELAP